MLRWIIVLLLLAVPIFVHEAWHLASYARSPLYSLLWIMEWARPLFEDEGLVAGHVMVNFSTVGYVTVAMVLLAKVALRQRKQRQSGSTRETSLK